MDYASSVALVISGACLALALVFFGRAYTWRVAAALKLQEHEDRLDRQRDSKASLAERVLDLEGRMKSVNAWESAMSGAQIDRNIEMDGIRDRIDALSTRMDAVELTCGLREKPKTMGGS